jgi:hypothetical protein
VPLPPKVIPVTVPVKPTTATPVAPGNQPTPTEIKEEDLNFKKHLFGIKPYYSNT